MEEEKQEEGEEARHQEAEDTKRKPRKRLREPIRQTYEAFSKFNDRRQVRQLFAVTDDSGNQSGPYSQLSPQPSGSPTWKTQRTQNYKKKDIIIRYLDGVQLTVAIQLYWLGFDIYLMDHNNCVF